MYIWRGLLLLISCFVALHAQSCVTISGVVNTRVTLTNNPKSALNSTWVLQYIGSYAASNTKISAMKFAVQRINSDLSFLPNIRLELYGQNAGGDKATTLSGTIVAYNQLALNGFIGGETFTETQYVQYMASSYNAPQINPTSVEASLYNSNSNPTLLHMLPSSADQQNVVVTLMNQWGIKSALVITTTNQYGNEFNTIQYNANAVASNITFQSLSIANSPADNLAGSPSKLDLAKQFLPMYRYVIMHGAVAALTAFYTELGKANFTGPDYLYIFTHQAALALLERPDSYKNLHRYLGGAVGIVARFEDDNPFAKQVLSEWAVQYPSYAAGKANITLLRSSWFAFDTIYAYAYALDAMIKDGLDATNKTVAAANYLTYLTKLNFTGVTGEVNFDSNNRGRRGFWDIVNFAYDENATSPLTGVTRAVACYNCTTLHSILSDFIFPNGNSTVPPPFIPCPQDCVECTPDGTVCLICAPTKFIFQGVCLSQCPNLTYVNDTECLPIPPDPVQPEPKPITYRKHIPAISIAFGAIIAVAVLFAGFAAVMLAAFWRHFSKHGSFYCAVIIAGVFVTYVAALVLLPVPTDTLCLAFPWFLGIGFTLVYGCLFIKTWALFRIFKKAEQLKKSNMSPMYIISRIVIYVAIEAAFLVVWSAVDRPKASWQKMVDDTYQLQCVTEHPTFWSIFAATKGIWLIFGAILSVLTHHVAKEFNESKSIGYAIYNIIALLVVAIPLCIALKNIPGGLLIIEAGVIVVALSFTMFVLFFPVWYSIFFPDRVNPNTAVMYTTSSGRSGSSVSLSRGSHPSHSPRNSPRSTAVERHSSSARSKDSRDSKERSHSEYSVSLPEIDTRQGVTMEEDAQVSKEASHDETA